MIKKILYKGFSKLSTISAKAKQRFAPTAVSVPPNVDIQFIDGYYYKLHNDRRIFSPSINGLNSLYLNIFKNQAYGFKSESEKPVIIDCGANIGLGVIYWKELFPQAKIIAFEPSIKVFEALKKNMQEFGYNDVVCMNAALSTSEGYKEFTYHDDLSLSGSLLLEKNLGQTYQVQTVLLEKYLQEPIDFLKIDIEGEEVNIFPQVAKNINNIHNLFLEYHSFIQHSQSLSEFLKVLEDNQYRYYIEGEYKHKGPLLYDHVNMEQDLQVGIWAKKFTT